MALNYTDMKLRLTRYIGRRFSRAEDVEDIVQESFLKVLEAGSKGKIEYPTTYLYRTAHNLAINSLTRKSHRQTDSLEDLLGSDVLGKSAALEDDLMAQERFQLFCRAVASLPEVTRHVLILRRVYGLSRKEVAAELDISVSGVEKHLAKGLDNCINYMIRCEYSPTSVVKANRNPSNDEERCPLSG